MKIDQMATAIDNLKQYITVPEAARMLGISRPTMRSILDRGDVEYITPSVQRRVSLQSLLRYKQQVKGGVTVTDDDDWRTILDD